MKSVLLAGISKIDITPAEPLFMGGYSLRGGRSRAVRGKLFVRALVLGDGRRHCVFVMADLIDVMGETLRFEIGEKLGLDPATIFVGDTHNHAGPLSRARPKGQTQFGNDHTRWFRQFPQAAFRAVKQALARLQPVKIGQATGRSSIAVNRRKRMTDSRSVITFDENNVSQSFGVAKTSKKTLLREHAGVVRLGANPSGPIDDEVGIVRIDALDGRPLAVLINYACHGTSLGGRNDTICGEWMGRMMTIVENETGAQPIYFQGAAGDINPRVVGGLDGHKDSMAATEKLGEELAREVVRAHRRIKTAAPKNVSLRSASATIQLPRCYRDLFSDFKNTSVDVPTTVLKLGGVTYVNFPGEMFHETGLRVKRAAPTPLTFIAGYTNGSIGYMPTAEAFAEGGYEPAVSHLDPVAEQLYLKKLKALMAKMR